MTDETIVKNQILRMETALADAEVRCSEIALSTILHSDFTEIGKSGKLFSYKDIMADLAENPSASNYDITEFNVKMVNETMALATYRIPARQQKGADLVGSRRSSLWIKEDGIWLLYFHQGTPL